MKIRTWSVDTFWKGELRIRASVEEQDVEYKTDLLLRGGQPADCSCSCAEENSVRNLCVHAGYVLSEYQKKARAERRLPVSASSFVRTMIQEYTNQEIARIMEEEETGEVRLLPRLLFGRESVFLECRLVGKRTYLIKNLAEFAEAVRTGRRLEYGKGMAFEHTPAVFAPESRPLLAFMVDEAERYLAHDREIKGKRAAGMPMLSKLSLSRQSIDRLCTLLTGKTLLAEDGRGAERRLFVVRDNPSFLITVKKYNDDGILLTVPAELMAFSGEEYLYVADAETLYCCDREYTETVKIFLEQLLSVQPGYASGSGKRELTVNHRDVPLFYARVLCRLKRLGLLADETIDWNEYRPPKLQARFVFDSTSPEEITMKPTLFYGNYSFHPLKEEQLPDALCRDVVGEFRISRLITRYFSYCEEETKHLIIRKDEEALYRLLREGIAQFQELGEVLLSETIRALRVRPFPKLSFGVSAERGWLNLELHTGDLDRTELIRLLSGYKQRKNYYRMKNGEFLELSENGLLLFRRLGEDLGITKQALKENPLILPAYRACYLDSLLGGQEALSLVRDRSFSNLVRDLHQAKKIEAELPQHLASVLREYQKTGVFWLKTLAHYGFGGILADDMGLGKTIQILALLSSSYDEEKQICCDSACSFSHAPSLIVCPASLIYNWGQECEQFAPTLRVLLVSGSRAERQRQLASADHADVIITSYDLLRRDFSCYEGISFRFQVLDEAQQIKNASTQIARAVKAVRAQTRFALTGTPVENRLSELWSIFDFLMPGFLFTYRRFKTVFELPIVKNGDKEAAERLQRMIRPFVLRRPKKDVLKELPEKLERIYYSAAEGEQHMLYQAAAWKLRQALLSSEETEKPNRSERSKETNRIEILAQLTRLRQICCDPALCVEHYEGGSAKLETCLSLITSAVAGGHKLLLFSQFASMLERIAERLRQEAIPYLLLTGAVTKKERNRMVSEFQENEIPVFLISLKAGGTGLNLTAADVVIHYDPWWNLAAQQQATDRAYRIGQKRQVTVYRLILKYTIEENILRLQESKQKLADQIIKEGMVSLGELGRDELLQLLGEEQEIHSQARDDKGE